MLWISNKMLADANWMRFLRVFLSQSSSVKAFSSLTLCFLYERRIRNALDVHMRNKLQTEKLSKSGSIFVWISFGTFICFSSRTFIALDQNNESKWKRTEENLSRNCFASLSAISFVTPVFGPCLRQKQDFQKRIQKIGQKQKDIQFLKEWSVWSKKNISNVLFCIIWERFHGNRMEERGLVGFYMGYLLKKWYHNIFFKQWTTLKLLRNWRLFMMHSLFFPKMR